MMADINYSLASELLCERRTAVQRENQAHRPTARRDWVIGLARLHARAPHPLPAAPAEERPLIGAVC